jgi:FkbM family methyltransferase
MKPLIAHTYFGLRYKRWSWKEAVLYLLQAVARELHFMPVFWKTVYEKQVFPKYIKKWKISHQQENNLNIHGIKLADISEDVDLFRSLYPYVYEDSFCFFVHLNDNYDKGMVTKLDKYMGEGPYGYVDGDFDVRVKSGDVVIDAGAWIGDFSAYAAIKGATSYAFEPISHIYSRLCETAALNNGQIIPCKYGLGKVNGEMECSVGGMGNSVIFEISDKKETINIITLDDFVEKNTIPKLDFIKADIEGAERDLLLGAKNVLKKFAPKIILCTYHLPDDPEVLEKLILEANPDYRIIQLRHKIVAAVPNNKQQI